MSDDTTTPKPPPPPVGLAKVGRRDGAGRALWKSIFASNCKYVLRPDELRILEDACRLTDRAAELAAEADGRPRTVRGSTGQPVINPLLAEERQCRLAVAQLLKQLKLPDEDNQAGAGGTRSVGARAAAQSRWGKSG